MEEDKNKIFSNVNAVSIFEQVIPEKKAEEQQQDPTLKKAKNMSYSQNKNKSA